MWPERFPLFPERASTLAGEVDALTFTALGITVVFSLLIAVLILWLGVRYRRRRPDEVGHPEHAAMWLEVAWSVIPLGILLGLFGWGANVYFKAVRPPANAVEFHVVGKQWMWKIQHPEGNREINELHVPAGQPVKLTMTSEDVIHSFFIPAFRVKTDVIPGRYTTLWFEANRPGTYRLFCAEYCGAEHSRMIGHVTVLRPDEYEAWVAGGSRQPTTLASGAQLFKAKACDTCHRPDSAVQAPILHGLFGRRVALADGSTVTVDNDYLRESILDPAARVVAGYNAVMPTFQGQLSEEELLALIAYVKSLDGEDKGDPVEGVAGGGAAR